MREDFNLLTEEEKKEECRKTEKNAILTLQDTIIECEDKIATILKECNEMGYDVQEFDEGLKQLQCKINNCKTFIYFINSMPPL